MAATNIHQPIFEVNTQKRVYVILTTASNAIAVVTQKTPRVARVMNVIDFRGVLNFV